MKSRMRILEGALLAVVAMGNSALADPVVEPPPVMESGYDNGFYIRTPSRNYSLAVNGFAQLLYSMNASGSSARHNFDLGLGRLAFSGNIFDPKLSYFLQFEGSTFANHNRISMLDWWMRYTVSQYLSVRAGRGILPYSRQFYTHPGQLLFADLSVAEYAFGLYRTIGVDVGGSVGHVSYDLFVNNSIPALDNTSQANFGDAISAGARVEVAVLGGGYGYLESDPNMPENVQLSVGVATAYNTAPQSSGFQNSQMGDRTLNATGDLGFRWQRVTVQGAFYYRALLNAGGGHSFGYYGQAGCYILPRLLEGVARISQTFLPDRTTTGRLNASLGNASEYTAGLNVYLFGHGAKLQADYSAVDNRRFDGTSLLVHRVRIQTQILF